MTTEIAKREVKYIVFLKKLDATDKEEIPKQFVLNEQDGKILSMVLQSPNCPSFIPIRGNLYNKFDIARIEIVNPPSDKVIAQNDAERRYYEEAEKIRIAKLEKIHWKT